MTNLIINLFWLVLVLAIVMTVLFHIVDWEMTRLGKMVFEAKKELVAPDYYKPIKPLNITVALQSAIGQYAIDERESRQIDFEPEKEEGISI